MSKTNEWAKDCLSLSYKYTSLMDCVESQRSGLLNDPVIRQLMMQKKIIEDNFESYIRQLAGSWKGGLMGWSVEWKQGETMEDAFDRWSNTWDGK
jgi:hypothetical protein